LNLSMMSSEIQNDGSSHQVLVNTVNGEVIGLEVPQSSLVSDVKRLACERFGYQPAKVRVALGHDVLTDSQSLSDVGCGSGSTLTLIMQSLMEVPRRVWMVPTLGYKGSGKGLPDEFLRDGVVLLEPDLPVSDQLSQILVFDSKDLKDDDNTCPPPQKGTSKGPPRTGNGKGKGKSFNVHSTAAFVVPFGRLPETQSRSVLSDPPRPCINEDVEVSECRQTASEVFGDGTHEIVVFTPSYWWCPGRSSEGPRALLGLGDVPAEAQGEKGKGKTHGEKGKGK